MTLGKRGAFLAPLALLLVLSLLGNVAHAQGGFAMSGTFGQQQFQIPQGAEVSGSTIYVVVFNEGDRDLQVRMASEAPFGVEALFSEDEFPLKPGEQMKVYVTVRVGENAVPGEYQLLVRAEAAPEKVEGIAIGTAVAQRAKLTVTGQSALVEARVVSPDGQPVVAEVRLFKLIDGRENEFAFSNTGILEVKVSPGHYVARAYVGGKKLAEEFFDVAAGETKTITLTVKTVYFAHFGIVLNYYTETGELAFVKVVYQISNLYQPMADVGLVLKVSLDGEALEEIPLLSLSELSLGDIGGSWEYTPPQGWEAGTYTFQAELYVGGKLYTTSLEEELEVAAPTAVTAPFNLLLIVSIAAGVLIIGMAILLVVVLRRRRQY